MQLYNTLTRSKEDFTPLTTDKVSFYQCGPTVYWTQHIGNMRAFVLSDLMRRSFTHLGSEVSFVRNYTDVGHLTSDGDEGEDKMEKAAKRDNLEPLAIAKRYIDEFETDAEHLNILPPTHTPRATEYIADMIQFIEKLLNDDFAYTTPLAVYFDITQLDDYTKLSKQDLSKLKSGSGSGDVTDPDKKNPHDFALWFFKAGTHEHALQTWKSPFESSLIENGEGFPGWHIECSTFIKSLLGDTIDVHMGGIEHIPIHHTNEIAQSESANKAPLAHYWLHNEHLAVDGGKMSKSEGTTVTVRDVVHRNIDPLALRYFFLQSHYRSGQNFTWDALEGSATALQKLRKHAQTPGGTPHTKYVERFDATLEDDFNFPEALALAWTLTKDATVTAADRAATLREFDTVFALNLDSPAKEVSIPKEIQKLVEERQTARDNKDWDRADELRDEITHLGFTVSDGPDGQSIEPR